MDASRRTVMTLLFAGGVAALALPVRAAIPDMSPAALDAEADLIVAGRLVATMKRRAMPAWVETRRDISFLERSAFVDEVIKLTIEVDSVVKGARDIAGRMIVAHGWRAAGRPSGWAGPGGTLRDLPAGGTRIKVWLKQEEGLWQLMSPSGLVPAP